MSVQRYLTPSGQVRYRARVKSHGREVARRTFTRKRDAQAWEEDQKRRLRMGEWIDPRRGRVPLDQVAEDWLLSRQAVKRNTRVTERHSWEKHIKPRFGSAPVASITSSEVASWVGGLLSSGLAPSTASRHLSALRGLLAFAVDDGRITVNVAAKVKPPTAGRTRREAEYLTVPEIEELARACHRVKGGPDYADVVRVLAFAGLRWGELAGLQVGDVVSVPGPGLRLQRTVIAHNKRGNLLVDSVKNHKARTVPLVEALVPIVESWSAGKGSDDWLFRSPGGGPLSHANWKRSVRWSEAVAAIGKPKLRVHDLRHTCASIWLGAGADPKVVQRILGHASATMTMDLYGHLIDHNLWEAAKKVGGISGAFSPDQRSPETEEGSA